MISRPKTKSIGLQRDFYPNLQLSSFHLSSLLRSPTLLLEMSVTPHRKRNVTKLLGKENYNFAELQNKSEVNR